MKKTILLVCDNRDSKNWGCRSTSIALGQILSHFGDVITTSRLLAAKPRRIPPVRGIFKTNRYFDAAINLALQSKIIKSFYRAIGGRADFIVIDPEGSVDLFLFAIKRADNVLHSLKMKFEKADVVVINGEGSLIFRTPPRRDLNFQLFAVELARRFDKPVHYVNAMASDCPTSEINRNVEKAVLSTLNKCTSVSTRDPVSQKRLNDMGVKNVNWYPDALFAWRKRYGFFSGSQSPLNVPELFEGWPESDRVFTDQYNWPESYICISGASRPPGVSPQKWVVFFERLLNRIKNEINVDLVVVDPYGDDFLEGIAARLGALYVPPTTNIFVGAYILARAKGYVSGRYHPSIMASLGGTPCSFLECNSHKTKSLQFVLEYENPVVFSFDSSDQNIAQIVEDISDKMKLGDDFRQHLMGITANRAKEVLAGFSSLFMD